MSNTYTVQIQHQGQTHSLEIAEDQKILQAAYAAGIELPSSCNAGVCTTCAAQVLEGTVDNLTVWVLVQNCKKKVMLCYV
jgi:ferredoxin